jgi:hypothetical protein
MSLFCRLKEQIIGRSGDQLTDYFVLVALTAPQHPEYPADALLPQDHRNQLPPSKALEEKRN